MVDIIGTPDTPPIQGALDDPAALALGAFMHRFAALEERVAFVERVLSKAAGVDITKPPPQVEEAGDTDDSLD